MGYNHKKSKGVALISTLIISFIITYFLITMLDSLILENKMTASLARKIISFELAESGLSLAKNQIQGEDIAKAKALENMYYSLKLLKEDKNIQNILISSRSEYKGAKTRLIETIEYQNHGRKIKILSWENN